MFGTFIKVLKNPLHVVMAVFVSLVVLSGALLLTNISLLVSVISNSAISIIDFLKLTFNLLGSLKTNFTIVGAIYTIIIAILFGINVGIITYYIIFE